MQKPAPKKPTKTKDSLRKDVLRVMTQIKAGLRADDGGGDV